VHTGLLLGIAERNRPLGRPRCRWKGDINLDIEVRHPRCVGSITKNFCILHVQSNTTILHLVVHSRNTTTCFGPICGPSTGCDLTYRAAIQDVWGVF